MKLTEQTGKPIRAGEKPLADKAVGDLLREIPAWSLKDNEIVREFRFKGFTQAMDFVNKVATLANEQDHHPDILISYNTVRLTLSTHKINGLSMNDFILAAKFDLLTDSGQGVKAA